MNKKILVVDDDPAIREQLVLGLAADYEMYEASDAKAARRAFWREIPSLVFLDVGLPDGSGMDLIRSFTSGESPAVVIMLTSNQDLDLARKALELGASEYVTKPCSTSMIKQIAKKRHGPARRPGGDHGVPWRTAK